MIEEKAYAKINLALEVLGRRDDGYHEVSTVLHAVGLADHLTFEESEGLSLECDDPAIEGEENLVLRAARLLQQAAGSGRGASITLRKGIPIAAGLGGGSSDAAVTLLALSRLWGIGLSRERLMELGATLGSDVPFFVQGSECALATGRGERVAPLPAAQGWWVVVLRPEVATPPNKTAMLYSMLSEDDFSDGSRMATVVEELKAGRLAIGELHNAFERVAGVAFPGLDEFRRVFMREGAPFAALAGSGPALYTLVDSVEQGRGILDALRREGHEAWMAAIVEATSD